MDSRETWITLTPRERLQALYEASRPLGMGRLHYRPGGLTNEEADKLLSQLPGPKKKFDYVMGRPIKTDVADNNADFNLFERDNGPVAIALEKFIEHKS